MTPIPPSVADAAQALFDDIDAIAEAGLSKFGQRCSRVFEIAGAAFALEFDSLRLREYFSWQMKLFAARGPASVRVRIWTDEIAGALSRMLVGRQSAALRVQAGKRSIEVYMIGSTARIGGLLFAWCGATKEGWVMIAPEQLERFIEISYMLTPLFSRIAPDIGMTLMHAAGVGVGDCGVLLSGLSGAGKSSLATACLMEGMRYVSDDTLFLRLSDNAAYPLCSTIHVAPDILRIFPGLGGPEILSRRGRGEKRHLDISSLGAQFAPGIRMRAIVALSIGEGGAFAIRPARWEGVVVPLVYSSVHLLGEAQNAGAVRNVLGCLRALPAYEFRMSGNLTYNARLLRRFIAEELTPRL